MIFGAGELVWHQLLLFISPNIIPDSLVAMFAIEVEENGEADKVGFKKYSMTNENGEGGETVTKPEDMPNFGNAIPISAGEKPGRHGSYRKTSQFAL